MLAPPVKNTPSLMIVGLIILLGFKPAHAQQSAGFPQPFDVIIEKSVPDMVVAVYSHEFEPGQPLTDPLQEFRNRYQRNNLPVIPPEMGLAMPESGQFFYAIQIAPSAVVPLDLERQELPGGPVISMLTRKAAGSVNAFQLLHDYVDAQGMAVDGNRPVREVYWTDPLNTPPDQIITEIQIPVQDG